MSTGALFTGPSSQEKPVTLVLPAVARGEQLAGTLFSSDRSWVHARHDLNFLSLLLQQLVVQVPLPMVPKRIQQHFYAFTQWSTRAVGICKSILQTWQGKSQRFDLVQRQHGLLLLARLNLVSDLLRCWCKLWEFLIRTSFTLLSIVLCFDLFFSCCSAILGFLAFCSTPTASWFERAQTRGSRVCNI